MNNELIEARGKKGLKQHRIASMIGVDRSTYAHYERGRIPSLPVAFKISKAVGKSIEKIFGPTVLGQHENSDIL